MMKFKTLLVALLMSASTFSFATGVMTEMFKMKKQLNALTQAETPDAFHQAAEIFVTQAQEAQNKTPISLSAEEDANRLKSYQAGIQEVIDVVKKADSQAQQGNLDEAKQTIAVLDEMKKKYHQEYK